ncbi:MAG: ActS/PrrB/RegB family redox-sensitive histidine kinase [Pseudomonadota bacterium]
MTLGLVQSFSNSFDTRRLRLSTLVNTRWLAVAGQGLTVAMVLIYLQFPLPVLPVALLIGASVALNMGLTWKFSPNHRLQSNHLFFVLAFDVIQLAGLLYFTGGLENPFSVLLVVPVVISAVSSPVKMTAALGGMVIIASSILVFEHAPLPWFEGVELEIPSVYLGGVWAAVVVSLGFSAFYIGRVAEEARVLAEALAETELVLQREMHLSALDGLAAAAAHELGTPLATISLVSREMDRAVTEPGDLKEDIALLRQQAERCREILGRLTTLQSTDETQMSRLPLMAMIEEVIAPHREFGVAISVEKESIDAAEPVGRRNPGILYGLGNLVENAVDFARSDVSILVRWNADKVTVQIKDDGPGFSPIQVERLGEPDAGRFRSADRQRKGSNGLGLGIFIAKTLLERTGASLGFANANPPHKGALVTVDWSRASIDTYHRAQDKEAVRDE